MKKILSVFLILFVAISIFPLAANAQQTCRNSRKKSNFNRNYYNQTSDYRQNGTRKKRSFYRRHRNLVNIGLASGGGAIVGGVIGGRKGMLTGALIGGGAGALYTYVLKKKKR